MNTKNANKNEAFMKALKSIHSIKDKLDLEKQRQGQEALGILFSPNKGISYKAVEIDGMSAEIVHKVKTYDTKHIILYFHGGAYITGNLNYARIISAKLAFVTGIDVLAIEYRLAPENPYPSQLEDAVKAWNYLIDNGYSSNNISIAGESAGGNLVLSLMHYFKIHEMNFPTSLVCMSPWTDLLSKGESYETKKDIDPMITIEFLKSAVEVYALDNDLSNPLISPIYGNFKGFPPTLIQVGSNEILLSDSLRLKDKLTDVGADCHIEIWKGMWHVFQMFPMKRATRAIQNAGIFITSGFTHTL